MTAGKVAAQMKTNTILIIDDHPMMRTALRIALEDEPDLAVVGEAGSVAEGRQKALLLKPDLMLVDIHLPDGSGVDLIHFRNGNLPEARILVVTSSENENDIMTAIETGAESYIVKNSSPEQLLQGVRAVLAGRSLISSSATRILLKGLRQPKTETGDDGSKLSGREKQILHQLAGGATNIEIAGVLHITESTLRTHFQRIRKKLSLPNHSQLMLYAIDHFK